MQASESLSLLLLPCTLSATLNPPLTRLLPQQHAILSSVPPLQKHIIKDGYFSPLLSLQSCYPTNATVCLMASPAWPVNTTSLPVLTASQGRREHRELCQTKHSPVEKETRQLLVSSSIINSKHQTVKIISCIFKHMTLNKTWILQIHN